MVITDWRERLAEEMDDRRVELRLEWEEVAVAAGISVATLRRIRRGASLTKDSAAAVERGLHWLPGSVAAIERGEPPFKAALPGPAGLSRVVDDVAAVAAEGTGLVPGDVEWILAATPRQVIARYLDMAEGAMGPDRASGWLVRAMGVRENYLRLSAAKNQATPKQSAKQVS